MSLSKIRCLLALVSLCPSRAPSLSLALSAGAIAMVWYITWYFISIPTFCIALLCFSLAWRILQTPLYYIYIYEVRTFRWSQNTSFTNTHPNAIQYILCEAIVIRFIAPRARTHHYCLFMNDAIIYHALQITSILLRFFFLHIYSFIFFFNAVFL